MQIKKYVRILFWAAFAAFVLNKFYLRPWILVNDFSSALSVFVLSLPNLIEVILGITVVTRIMFQLKSYLNAINNTQIYIISTLITGVYVISQELGFHNIGGNNVYDIYDILASILGLITMLIVFMSFGFIVAPKKEE